MIIDNKKEYFEILSNSFPKELNSDIELIVDIINFKKFKVNFFDRKTYELNNLFSTVLQEISLKGEKLIIPYRYYFDEPSLKNENKLNERQKIILNCIFLRHHNGYVREKRLRNIIDKNDYWVIPYTIQLLGEYVFDILKVLKNHINESSIENYKMFIEENPKYWQTTESRVISYWNVYYRLSFPFLNEYLGTKLVNKIKN